MEKSLFEQMGGTYTQVGDYLIPNLRLPEQQGQPIGVWGQRHARYLKQQHITEEKERNPMLWCSQLNNIRERATAIVNAEIIYV